MGLSAVAMGGILGGAFRTAGAAKALFGGKSPKQSAQAMPAASVASQQKSPAEVAEEEDENKKKRLLALNAGGNSGSQLSPGGGDLTEAPVTRKTLLGK